MDGRPRRKERQRGAVERAAKCLAAGVEDDREKGQGRERANITGPDAHVRNDGRRINGGRDPRRVSQHRAGQRGGRAICL
jgi:hypothetical protein